MGRAGKTWSKVEGAESSRMEAGRPSFELRAIAESAMSTASEPCSSERRSAKRKQRERRRSLTALQPTDLQTSLRHRSLNLARIHLGALLRLLLGVPARPDTPLMQKGNEIRIRRAWLELDVCWQRGEVEEDGSGGANGLEVGDRVGGEVARLRGEDVLDCSVLSGRMKGVRIASEDEGVREKTVPDESESFGRADALKEEESISRENEGSTHQLTKESAR